MFHITKFYTFSEGEASMFRRLCAVIVMGALFGCGHTRAIFLSPQMDNTPLRQLNREIGNRTAHLVLQDGRSFVARDTRVFPDSTFWHSPDMEVAWAVRTAEISRISFKNRKRGAVEGLVIGALILLPTAVMTNALSDLDPKPDLVSEVLNGVGAGVLYGAGIGALVGSRITYIIHPSEPVR